MTILLTILTIVCVAVSFFVTALILFGICWAFSLTFTWKMVIGIWLVLILIRSIFIKTNK